MVFERTIDINRWCDQHVFHVAFELRQEIVEEYGLIQLGRLRNAISLSLYIYVFIYIYIYVYIYIYIYTYIYIYIYIHNRNASSGYSGPRLAARSASLRSTSSTAVAEVPRACIANGLSPSAAHEGMRETGNDHARSSAIFPPDYRVGLAKCQRAMAVPPGPLPPLAFPKSDLARRHFTRQ